MASHEKQFERALAKWDTLHSQEAYSLPTELGKIGVVASGYYKKEWGETAENFAHEALQIADYATARGNVVEVATYATCRDMIDILRDETISTVYTIDNGSLSHFYIDDTDPKKCGDFDWQRISDGINHLKTGLFIQRHCGVLSRRLNVPLGTFAMTRHDAVLAPVGEEFFPNSMSDPDENRKMRTTCTAPRLDYEAAKKWFTKPISSMLLDNITDRLSGSE